MPELTHWAVAITSLAVYFLPTLIALVRDHHNKVAVIVTNLLLGWTGVVWLVALIWSFTNQKETQVIINNAPGAVK